jgi:N,N-dimethylformamidase
MDIQAYFEEWSRCPGETVRMAISTPHATVRATLVRLLSGPGQGDQPKGRTQDFSVVLDRSVPGRVQATAVGSYAQLPLPGPIAGEAISLHCWVWPTVPQRDAVQAIWSLGAVALVMTGGALQLRSGTQVIASLDNALVARQWYSVVATIGGGTAALDLHRLRGKVGAHRAVATGSDVSVAADMLMLAGSGLAASGSPLDAFNGKIDSPTVYRPALSVDAIAALHADAAPGGVPWAAWQCAQDFAEETLAPVFAGGWPGLLRNGVERGVTGHNWDGRSDSFIEVPLQYAALQFHDDDMVESGWQYDLDFTLPATLASGVYAARLEAGTSRNHFPLFVRGAADAVAPVLFLAPTNTYLAYTNDHLATLDFSSVMPHEKVVPADEQYLTRHPEPGRSCYDTHGDGTPVRTSSRRRPLFNVRPGFPNWLTGSYRHFPVDMYTVEWLEHVGIAYHVATDEDLERAGRALLDRSR